MPNTALESDIGKDMDDVSTRISSLVRGAAVAVIAVCWGFLVTPNERIHIWLSAVLIAMALAFVALLLDWVQYVVGYLNDRKSWHDLEHEMAPGGWTPDILYRARDGSSGRSRPRCSSECWSLLPR